MMDLEITINNYRCFADPKRINLNIKSGFTAFLGTNNSGKSSILRFFHEYRGLFSYLSSPSNDLIQSFNRDKSFTPQGVSDPSELFNISNDKDITITFNISEITWIITQQRNSSNFRSKMILNDRKGDYAPDMVSFNGTGQLTLSSNASKVADFNNFCNTMKKLSNVIYIGSFRNLINAGANENYFDLRVGTSFVLAWREFAAGTSQTNRQQALKVTADIKQIFGYENLQIDVNQGNTDLLLTINSTESRLLSHMGSGIAHFIFVLANVAMKKPSLLLIDEPETGLHPSLQIHFLTCLQKYVEDGVVFATHSYGLARATADRIYTLRSSKVGSTLKKYDVMPRLSEFLGELSYSGYKALGFNKILLVEGPTEIKTMHQFLRFYYLDHKVAVISLGGSDLINGNREHELQEITRISTEKDTVFAIIDSEKTSSDDSLNNDRKKFRNICEHAAITLLVLDRRSIENYLADGAVKKVKGSSYRGLQPYEKLEDASPHWGKNENWMIAKEMTKKDLDQTDLGQFLESMACPPEITSSDTGTVQR